MGSDDTPVLWQYTFSNFNEKVRWALDYKGIPHVRRSVFPGGFRALRFSRTGTIPVLDLGAERIVDSTAIIAALERYQPDPPLYPTEEMERERALELEDFFDEHAGHELRRAAFWEMRDDPGSVSALLSTGQAGWARPVIRSMLPVALAWSRRRYKIYEADAEEAKVKVSAALDRIEAELQPSGYLAGDSFSVADLTAAALLYPLVNPPEVQYRLPPPPDPLQAWMDSLAGHPATAWIGETYRRHRGGSAEIGKG
jgi:glutathione S-transferase